MYFYEAELSTYTSPKITHGNSEIEIQLPSINIKPHIEEAYKNEKQSVSPL